MKMHWTGFAAVPLAAALWIAAVPGPRNPEDQAWQTLDGSIEVPAPVAAILNKACRNCHSNETARLFERDAVRARRAMNLSTWAVGAGRTAPLAAATLAAACADIRSGRMPLPVYRWVHPESRLSDAEKRTFCAWANQASETLLTSAGPGGR